VPTAPGGLGEAIEEAAAVDRPIERNAPAASGQHASDAGAEQRGGKHPRCLGGERAPRRRIPLQGRDEGRTERHEQHAVAAKWIREQIAHARQPVGVQQKPAGVTECGAERQTRDLPSAGLAAQARHRQPECRAECDRLEHIGDRHGTGASPGPGRRSGEDAGRGAPAQPSSPGLTGRVDVR